MPPTYYRGCWHVVSRGFLVRYRLFSSLLIELYIPKYFFTHAASLHQGFPHCAIFPTAASRRSLGPCLSPNVAVHSLKPATDRRLGEPLPHQPANQTRTVLLPARAFHTESCDSVRLCGISSRFQLLSPCIGQVPHALLTRPPLSHIGNPSENFNPKCFVRLACVKHAASVHPEPGSNSHVQSWI